MKCPKCGSENVNVMVEQTGSKTRTKKMGCLWSFCRGMLIFCTFGLWLLIGKRKETGKTTYTNKTAAVCQNCGHKWYV